VVPEVNKADLKNHEGIIAIPNCSTTPLVMVLNVLRKISPISRVTVDTYQSVSGTGTSAVTELKTQTENIVDGKPPEVSVYPHQIGFNLLPHIEDFLPNGYTKEEMKISNETRKILHDPNINISATCVRVPVFTSHSESAHIEFDGPIDIDAARNMLAEAEGIKVLDEPDKNLYPMPIVSTGQDEVFVGRLREDISKPNSIALWLASDNLRKGAALNAIQIAEELISMN
jgi:aspartate-semialdehyde dehydrogenase